MRIPKIIAIDFDDTLAENSWPDISKARLKKKTVKMMERELSKRPDTVFILWTCRTDSKLQEAIDFIKQHRLPIHLFNENHPSITGWWELSKPRKIYANEYWDDKAVTIT